MTRTRAALATLALVAAPLAPVVAPTAAASARTPDTLFPDQGNAGYQVRSYDVEMTYQPVTNNADASVTIKAKARRTLRSFHLDYEGPAVSTVTVDGKPATSEQHGSELVVTPAGRVRKGGFTVRVAYAGRPPQHTDPDGSTEGWVRTSDGALALGEPIGAMTWLPSNNTPSDKARFSYEVTVPLGYQVVANGDLVDTEQSGTQTTYTWRSREPMSTYLAMLGIGRYDVSTDELTSVDGRTIPVWSYTDSAAGAGTDVPLADVLAFEEKLFGPYPFSSTGLVVDDAMVGYALETQTRPFYPPGATDDLTVVHEMAHQWFGDSVTLTDWHDIWLAEGFATYAEWLWDSKHGGDSPQAHFDTLYAKPADNGLWHPAPTEFTDPADLFASPVYNRGAMTLQVLRNKVGSRHFFTIVKKWAAQHEHGNVRTSDFETLSEKVSGKDLDALFDTWLRMDGKPSGY